MRFELPPGTAAADIAGCVRRRRWSSDDGHVEFTTLAPTADLHAVTGWALERGVELMALSVARPSLEDVFLSLGRRGAARRTCPMADRYPAACRAGPPVRLPDPHVQPDADRRVLHDPAAAGDARAVQRPVRRQHGRHRVGEWRLSQFYTGGLAAFTAVSATFTNLANAVPVRRDEGVLKRWRGTPLPPWSYIGGLIGSAIVLAAAGVV